MIGYRIPERESYCILPLNQLSHAYFLAKGKKYNILSLFLQIHIVESTIPHPRSGWSTLSFKKGAPFRKLSFYRLWHSAQLSYKDIIKRDFLFSGKSHFIFILVHMSRTDLPFQLSILATQPGLISGTSPRICM